MQNSDGGHANKNQQQQLATFAHEGHECTEKLNLMTMEALDTGAETKKKKLEELKAEFEPLTALMKEDPSDIAEVRSQSGLRRGGVPICTYTSLLHCAHVSSALVTDAPRHSR